ncbi:TetR/AcrR family transcriptional regulator [Neomegalonema sp.]|uniref:TetR/AcrR family transcriptional regulator n=1 Tax=Neomegalonema sp. TaxID=2039713 RepID=UPI0026360212|nr:TetR/AcrR family transcriptional regulator [Neomegalonema sp.]MDD2869482.1 TetR/AcrR family transcriptional regulator [Neomegalonema sp.]
MARPRKSEDAIAATREALILKAQEVIGAEGLGALTARRLAAEAGCAVGSIYTHFPNLDAVIRQASLREFEGLRRALETRRASARTEGLAPEATLLALAEAYLRFAQTRGRNWSAIFEHRPADAPPEWFHEARAAPFRIVEEVLEDLAGPEAAPQGARALWAALHGVESLASAGHLALISAPGAEELARDLVQGYISGLRARTPAPAG